MAKKMILISNGLNRFPLSDLAIYLDKNDNECYLICSTHFNKGRVLHLIIYNLCKFLKFKTLYERSFHLKISVSNNQYISDLFFILGMRGKIFPKFISDFLVNLSTIIYEKNLKIKFQNLGVSNFIYRSGYGGSSLTKYQKEDCKFICYHSAALPVSNKYPSNLYQFDYGVLNQRIINDLDMADIIIAEGESVYEALKNSKKYANKKILLKNLSIDNSFISYVDKTNILYKVDDVYTAEKINVLFCGSKSLNMSLHKGLNEVLNIVDRLKDNKNIQFHLIGETNLKNDKKYENLRSEENIIFYNNLPRSSLAKLLQKSHILILPSEFEGNSRTTIEAMYCGNAILISRNVGSPGRDNVNYKKIDKADLDQWKASIEDFEKDRKKLQSMMRENFKLKFDEDVNFSILKTLKGNK